MNDNVPVPMLFGITAPVQHAVSFNGRSAGKQGIAISPLVAGGAYVSLRHADGTLLAAELDAATLDRFAGLIATVLTGGDPRRPTS